MLGKYKSLDFQSAYVFVEKVVPELRPELALGNRSAV